MEQWKPVKGYEKTYLVSNTGRVKRVGKYRNQVTEWESNYILTPGVKDNNYLVVNLSKNNKTRMRYVHRLVAEAFIDNPEGLDEVNHKDGNKANNNADNLEWVTRSENQLHAYKKLNRPTNKNHPKMSKTVIQLDLDGNIINRYPSYREAQRQTGVDAIDKVCTGYRNRKTAGGFMWRYEENL